MAELWGGAISNIMNGLGWRSSREYLAPPPSHSPTFDVLKLLAGVSHRYWEPRKADPAVAAIARAVLAP